MSSRSWGQIGIYEEIVFAEKRKPQTLTEAANDFGNDLSKLAVRPPERGGSLIGGFKVDNYVEENMRALLDKGMFGYHTKADICRTALTHFITDQVIPALEGPFGKRFQAYRSLLKAEQEENTLEHQTMVLRAAERVYTQGTLKKRPNLHQQALFQLESFLNSYTAGEDEFLEMRDMLYRSHVLGEAFKAYYERPKPVDPEEEEAKREDWIVDDLERRYGAWDEKDDEARAAQEALDALAAEQDEK